MDGTVILTDEELRELERVESQIIGRAPFVPGKLEMTADLYRAGFISVGAVAEWFGVELGLVDP